LLPPAPSWSRITTTRGKVPGLPRRGSPVSPHSSPCHSPFACTLPYPQAQSPRLPVRRHVLKHAVDTKGDALSELSKLLVDLDARRAELEAIASEGPIAPEAWDAALEAWDAALAGVDDCSTDDTTDAETCWSPSSTQSQWDPHASPIGSPCESRTPLTPCSPLPIPRGLGKTMYPDIAGMYVQAVETPKATACDEMSACADTPRHQAGSFRVLAGSGGPLSQVIKCVELPRVVRYVVNTSGQAVATTGTWC